MQIVDEFFLRSQKSHVRDFVTLCNHRIKLCEEINDFSGKTLNEKLKRYATVVLKKLEKT